MKKGRERDLRERECDTPPLLLSPATTTFKGNSSIVAKTEMRERNERTEKSR